MSKVGQKIPQSVGEFGDVLKSGEPLQRLFTFRSCLMPAEPAPYDGPAVRAVRERFAMSQGVFARFLGVSSAMVQSWEQVRRLPSPIARRLPNEMAANPEHLKPRFAHPGVRGGGPGHSSRDQRLRGED